MRTLLFVQTGDARPTRHPMSTALRRTLQYGTGEVPTGPLFRAFDRWFLVSCANAEAGRFVIANAAIGGLEHWPGKGRILAHGGKR